MFNQWPRERERERERRAGSTPLETVQWISNCEAEIYSWIQHCPWIRGEGICVARIILTCLRRFYIADEISVALDTLDHFFQQWCYLCLTDVKFNHDDGYRYGIVMACNVVERYNYYLLYFFISIIIRMEKLSANVRLNWLIFI